MFSKKIILSEYAGHELNAFKMLIMSLMLLMRMLSMLLMLALAQHDLNDF